ncbi:MAG: hypothetical protein ABIB47_03205 [Candidatus Woesearchaeota archaeon]
MKKAQISIEWLFAIGTLFLVFLLVLGFSFDKKIEVMKTEKYIGLRGECLKLSEIIVSTFLSGNGTEIQTQISYNASIDPNNQLITIEDVDLVTCTIPINRTSNVDLEEGLVILSNVGDYVDLENG